MRKLACFTGVLIFMMVLISCSQSTDPVESFEVYEKDGNLYSEYATLSLVLWENADLTETRFNDLNDFLLEIDDYVKEISSFIGYTDWKDLYYDKHGDDLEFIIEVSLTSGPSRVKGGANHTKYLPLEFKLNESLIEIDKAPIAHELTHLIAPISSSLSFKEGLACYIQDHIGKNPSVFNHGEPIFQLSKTYLEGDRDELLEEVVDNIGQEGIPEQLDLEAHNLDVRRPYYILSYSFTNYLIDEYGIDKFMIIYQSKNLYDDYVEVYSRDLDVLKEEWIEFILNDVE